MGAAAESKSYVRLGQSSRIIDSIPRHPYAVTLLLKRLDELNLVLWQGLPEKIGDA